jgi:serine/threonine protein phosphatase PrpC
MYCTHAINSGSTAVVVLIRDGQMWSANAGDSRAILATTGDTDATTSQLQLVALTTDHNPDLPTEKVMEQGSDYVIVHGAV